MNTAIIIKVDPDRLNFPLRPAHVGKLSSAEFAVAGVPPSLTNLRIIFTTPDGNTYTVVGSNATGEWRVYASPFTFPDAAVNLNYDVIADDAFGNPRGGIRVPSVVYPTARYQNYNINENGEVSSTFGTAYPFSAALLKELYGSLENYCELLSCEYDRLVGQGFLLKEDKEAFLSFTLDVAKQRGLE